MIIPYMGKPIPPLPSLTDWGAVPIHESGETLVDISLLSSERIKIDPQYYKQKISGALNHARCRFGNGQRLMRAAELLPGGFCLLVLDAWRPLEVQRALFHVYQRRLALENPGLSHEDLDKLTRTYVSYPSEDPNRPPIHSTGGAIDLTIIDEKGDPLNMGTVFDEFSGRAATRFYEIKHVSGERLSHEDYGALRNRRLLYHVMTKAGFVNYPEEWWHYDFGDQLWGAVTGQPACYGYAEFR